MPIYNSEELRDKLYKAIQNNVEANNAGWEAIGRLRTAPSNDSNYRNLLKDTFVTAGRMPLVREILQDADALTAAWAQFASVPKDTIPDADTIARGLLAGVEILDDKAKKLAGFDLEAELAKIDAAERAGRNPKDGLTPAAAKELEAELANVAPASSVSEDSSRKTSDFRQRLNDARSPQSVQDVHDDASKNKDFNTPKPGT